MSFVHQHPYPPFIPDTCQKLIVGTIPPPRFSTGTLHKEDVDFCYGSKFGLLWPILERIFNIDLDYENTARAIEQRKQLLARNRIGICDMVDSCTRERMDASDIGMRDIRLRNLKQILTDHQEIDTILFMGGNSKNGPEQLFRKHAKELDWRVRLIDSGSPRINEVSLNERNIQCVSLISPSSAANRAIGGHPIYKKMKSQNASYSTLDFRVSQFSQFF